MAAPERELKIMLDRQQYETLLAQYPFQPPVTQTNVYFDTRDSLLKQGRKALRTRTIGSQNLVTLKLPIDEITKEEFEFPVSSDQLQTLPDQELSEILPYIPPREDLIPIAKIVTERSVLETSLGTFCLDKNDFDGISDYELEYEYKKDHDGISILDDFLKPIHLKYEKNGPNKIARAMSYKENL